MNPRGFIEATVAEIKKHINRESAGHRRRRSEGEMLPESSLVDSTPSDEGINTIFIIFIIIYGNTIFIYPL
jgi:hypothetical protein